MININDNYAFEADDLNYILMRKTYKRRKENGTWVTTDEETLKTFSWDELETLDRFFRIHHKYALELREVM